jgi:hypothetical protein
MKKGQAIRPVYFLGGRGFTPAFFAFIHHLVPVLHSIAYAMFLLKVLK